MRFSCRSTAKTRVDDPFPVSVDIDPNKPTRYIPRIWQGGLSLGERGYYVNTDPESVELRNKFVAHAARLLGLAGYADSQQQAEQLLALETKLAEVQLPREHARDVEKTNNIMPRADVEQLGQGAPLREMFDALKLPAATDFQVGMPDVLRKTAGLFATEPLDAWKAYMRYHVLHAYGGELSTPFADELFDFYGRTMAGAQERAPRDKRGVSRVSNELGDPVGELYVDAHFSQQTRDKARALVENLRKAYSKRIDGASWMAPETKKEAQAKLAALVAKIGYPDKWKSYATVKIRAGDLVGNENNLAMWSWNDDVSKLGKPIDRAEWNMTPQTNNAYYSPRLNDIVFPAAILQPPNFDPAADPAANYGAIGATIGHEMSHAFDDQGRKSDGTGVQRDWWTPADAERYVRESDKLVEQFNGYEPLPGNRINGQADTRREYRRSGGTAHRLRRLQAVPRRKRGARNRRPHRRPAVLHRLRGELEGDLPARNRAQAIAVGLPQPRQVPGQRDRPQHGRVVCGVQCPAGRLVVSQARGPRSGVVTAYKSCPVSNSRSGWRPSTAPTNGGWML